MKKTTLTPVSRRHRCEICDGDHKCSRGADGLILCGRPPSERPQGYIDLGPAKGDPQFHAYRLDDRAPQQLAAARFADDARRFATGGTCHRRRPRTVLDLVRRVAHSMRRGDRHRGKPIRPRHEYMADARQIITFLPTPEKPSATAAPLRLNMPTETQLERLIAAVEQIAAGLLDDNGEPYLERIVNALENIHATAFLIEQA